MKKGLIIISISIFAIFLSGCSNYLNIYEDKLYSEKIFEEYEENSIGKNSGIFTREKAIEKAINIFDKAFNVKIDRNEMSEFISLRKKSSENTFIWSIVWYSQKLKLSYNCEVDSNDGKILAINKSKLGEALKNKREIYYDEAEDIVTPFLLELNIDINDYYFKPSKNDYLTDSSQNLYSSFVFYNKDNNNEEFYVLVDSEENKVISYQVK